MHRMREARVGAPQVARLASVTRFMVLFAGLGLSLGCASSGGTAPPDAAAFAGGYRVGPPDELTVHILPDPPIERDVVVRPDGMISIDLIGDVMAGGRRPSEIAADIQERIARFKKGASVTVAVTSAQSPAVTVLGEVLSPSTFSLQRETRVAEALGQVRGVTNFAADDRIKVVRYNGESVSVFMVNLEAIKSGDFSTNIRLQGGDLVVVPRTRMASVGFALQGFFFPFQQIFGFGASVATTVITGAP